MISEGNVGLMQAVKKFEPDKGFRPGHLRHVVDPRVRSRNTSCRSWSLVKMGTTAAQKKLFFNLRKAKSEISALEEGDLHPDQVRLIATRLGVLDEEVISMNRRLAGPDASLNAPLRADSENEWQDWLADETQVSQETQLAEDEEKSIRMGLLEEAMTELTDRERHILTERRLKDDPTTLEELAAQYGVSRERVRQIEVRAFEKLQKAMRAAAHERNLVAALTPARSSRRKPGPRAGRSCRGADPPIPCVCALATSACLGPGFRREERVGRGVAWPSGCSIRGSGG